MNDLNKKIKFAIRLMQQAAAMAEKVGQPLEICYSGGKDSDVILTLAEMAGVAFKGVYKCTGIDPRGTISHAKERGCVVLPPKKRFRQCIVEHGLPSRFRRHCCGELKEYKVYDYAVVGVRRDESTKRAARYKEPEICRVYNKNEKSRQYLPILEWSAEDIAEFIAAEGIKCHPLYYDECGKFHVERRLGCIGCPLKSKKKRIEDFMMHPNYIKLYTSGAEQFLATHPNSKQHRNFRNAYEWFVMSLFADNMVEFRNRFGTNLFEAGTDCKQFLEDYFKITL